MAGFNEIKQSANEFALDVHVVAQNFLGEQDWLWLKNPTYSKGICNSFQEEMMEGTRYYSNDSGYCDRLWLGLGATLWTPFYFSGRLIYDGVLNTYEYGANRLSSTPPQLNRKPNAYVLGAPLSLPFITAMGITEIGLRTAGLSEFGGQIISAAHRRSTNMLSRYLCGVKYSADEIAAGEAKLAADPKTGWNYFDRAGYVTLPGIIAFAEVTCAATASIALHVGEVGVRILGINEYGGHIISAAHRRSVNMMSRYVCGTTYSAEEIAAGEAKLMASPETGWNYFDRAGYVTLPGAIALAEVTCAATATVVLHIGEVGGRILGVTEYGGQIIAAAHRRSTNMLSRYTCGFKYSAEEIAAGEAKLMASPETGWNYLDRAGFVTLPGVIALTEVTCAVTASVVLNVGEAGVRILGISEYGGQIIAAAHRRSVNMLSRYLCGAKYSADEITAGEAKLMASPETDWDYLDRVGYVTIPGAIALTQVTCAATASVALHVGEAGVRMLGISEYGGQIIAAAHRRSVNMLSRYLCGIRYTDKEINDGITKLDADPATCWDNLDRMGYYTLPGAIALTEVTFAAVASVTLHVGEAGVRMLGINEYSGHIIAAAHRRSVNMMSRYLCGTKYSAEEIAAGEAKLIASPETGWNYFDRMGYVTLPGAIALTEFTVAATLGATGHLGEMVARISGISTYGGYIISAAHKRSVNMLSRYLCGINYSSEEIATGEAKLTASPETGWNYFDRAGYITLPGAVALLEVSSAATLGLTLRLGEGVGRILGFTEYGGHIISAAHMRAANRLSRYTHFTYSEVEIGTEEIILIADTETRWNYLDRFGYVTLPGAIALTEMAGATALGLTLNMGEIALRSAGVSEYSGYIISAAHRRSVNMLSRYLCGIKYSPDEIAAGEAKLTATPETGWNYFDRAGYVSLPGMIALTQVTCAATASVIFHVGEVGVRMLGVSEFGGEIISAAHRRSVNMLSRYLCGAKYSSDEIAAGEAKLAADPETGWNYFDRVGYVTLPGVIALAEVTCAATTSVVLHVGEVGVRMLGVSEFGGEIISAGHRRSVNMLSRYLCGAKYSSDEIAAGEAKLAADPETGWNYFDRVGYVTLPGVIALAEVTCAATTSVVLHVGEASARVLGVSEYGGDIIAAAHRRSVNILSRYLCGAKYAAEEIAKGEAKLTASPKTGWNYFDRAGYVTLPGAIALTEITGAIALKTTFTVIEGIGRCLGISEQSKNLYGIAFSHMGNMYGCVSDPAALQAKWQKIKTPVRSGWDVCDKIGLVTSTCVSVVTSAIASIPALIGLSKSNWHRAKHYWHHVGNAVDERRGKVVDRTLEHYHEAQLKQCESTSTGKFFSRVNILNGAAELVSKTMRWVVGPLMYGTLRIVKNLAGIIPFTKWVWRSVCPPLYDANNPFDRVTKRIVDLKKSLDIHGHLPIAEGMSDLKMESVNAGVKKAESRAWYERLLFSTGKECRKIFSLGHTIEEKVIGEFKEKFAEYVKICKRHHINNPNGFFQQNSPLPRGQRFSFEAMVEHIQGSYASAEEKQAIQRIATLVRGDIEREMKEIKVIPQGVNNGQAANHDSIASMLAADDEVRTPILSSAR